MCAGRHSYTYLPQSSNGVMASCMRKRLGIETLRGDLRGTSFGVKLTLAPFNCSEASGRIGQLRLPQAFWQMVATNGLAASARGRTRMADRLFCKNLPVSGRSFKKAAIFTPTLWVFDQAPKMVDVTLKLHEIEEAIEATGFIFVQLCSKKES